MTKRVYYMTMTSILVALGVIGGSFFEFTVGVAKVAPMQHLINLISGALLGPWWALAQAFLTSLIRNIMGTGTILAFPGSMFGAFLSGLMFRYTKKLIGAVFGELIGTGIIGAIAAYPIASWLLGTKGALWLFVPSFFLSALVGVVIGYALLKSIWKTVIVPQMKK
ncbi:energy coupling factor transporter S component ThiW [Secundilactobacillus similis]|jgi:energy coupling factor transporter S component ThiW|uniref:ThiW protein n=1 Tax=Secundilactobacillus similis DSM 23365 = JCM 2765 TaxID=1423804 RepID=A0A0R2FJS4_9LACO|nr:energy coupling factor transporter S component ThiW [Secundilactobacillus similis]KRN24986.1 thiW protein [Secundilactobacillus similis DSM 23365 = JCM 2765]